MQRKRSGNHADGRTSRKRGYDSAWDRATQRFKEDHPWCLGCHAAGRAVPTDVVDHVIPHAGDKARFWNPSNWQPACYWHHSSIKPILERRWATGLITSMDLWLDSPQAVKLTKSKHRPAIGVDGLPIYGT